MSEKKVIGIRGLDLNVYEQIQELARIKNESIATVFNEALRKYLVSNKEVDYEAPHLISGQSRFELTVEALEKLNPLKIEDVGTLIILDDLNEISENLIQSNLEGIIRVQEIFCPKRLYYAVLMKSKNVGEITSYEGKWREEKVLRFFSSTKLTANILQRFKDENYRLKLVVSSGDLYLSPDISLELFDDVISHILVKGNLAVSDDLYASLLTKGTVEGAVQLLNKEGEPIDQIQYGYDFFTHDDPKKGKKKQKTQSPQFNFPFIPGLETLFESIEEIKEGVKSALENLDIETELNLDDFSTKKIKKKKRERVKPTNKK